MKAIVVDDEIYMLEALREAVEASPDITRTNAFSSCSAALEHATENHIDIAFLDINMRGIGGLELAERLLQLHPGCKIIFCTGYEKYAVSAFQLHAAGYLMKPITRAAVQKEIDHIKGVKATEKLLTVKCFGNFEVFYGGESLSFKRKKTKELFALLVDRNGAGLTAKQICAVLFPHDTNDIKNSAYLRQLILDLKQTLKSIGASDVLRHETPYYRIDPGLLNCDYFEFLETRNKKFIGEYMTQYSWAEDTCAMLQFEK